MITIDILSSSSKGNAYIVSDGVTNLLLEAGLPWKEIQKKSGFKRIDAVFISHEHGDHAKATKDVLKLGIPVYMPWHMSQKYQNHNAIGLFNLEPILNNKVSGTVFYVEHDVPNLGIALTYPNGNKLVYITDTMYCKYTFSNITHWMIECNYAKDILDANVESGRVDASLRNRIVKSHMELETVKNMLRANDLSKTEVIYLMHLSDSNSDEARFKREIQELTGKEVRIC